VIPAQHWLSSSSIHRTSGQGGDVRSVEVRTVGNRRQSAYGARTRDARARSNFLEKGPREWNRTIVDNDLERRNYDGNRVVTQSLTDGFLLTITIWRDMTMSDRRVFLATSGRHRQLYIEATHDEL
jgi:hypothetical protein